MAKEPGLQRAAVPMQIAADDGRDQFLVRRI